MMSQILFEHLFEIACEMYRYSNATQISVIKINWYWCQIILISIKGDHCWDSVTKWYHIFSSGRAVIANIPLWILTSIINKYQVLTSIDNKVNCGITSYNKWTKIIVQHRSSGIRYPLVSRLSDIFLRYLLYKSSTPIPLDSEWYESV